MSGYVRHFPKPISTNRHEDGVVSDRAIWRVAQLLMRKHGSDASLVIEKGARLMRVRGDEVGSLLCARIKQAIEALQAASSGRLN